MRSTYRAIGLLAVSVCVPSTLLAQQADSVREQIGVVLGEPVYRDQIRRKDGFSLDSELHRLFSAPLMADYRMQHQQEVTPTDAELDFAQNYFDSRHRERIAAEKEKVHSELALVTEKLQQIEQKINDGESVDQQQGIDLELRKVQIEARLKPPGRLFARFMLSKWKLQKHLYDNFGGGRLLWQQAGVEAFDAMHRWLQEQQAAGRFAITDPELRTEFYRYWNRSHNGMIVDEQQIDEWLEPPWALSP